MPAEQVFGGAPPVGGLAFILEMTKALAWPILVGGTIVHFRRHIGLLLTVLVRGLRRVNRWKFGEVELAAAVLAPAMTAAEARVDTARERLEGEGPLTPEERRKLVAQLESATSELAELRTAHEQVMRFVSVPKEHSRYGRDRSSEAFFRRLLAHIDRHTVPTQSEELLQAQVRTALTEDLGLSLKSSERLALIEKGLLNRDNTLTPKGIQRLRDLAFLIAKGFSG